MNGFEDGFYRTESAALMALIAPNENVATFADLGNFAVRNVNDNLHEGGRRGNIKGVTEANGTEYQVILALVFPGRIKKCIAILRDKEPTVAVSSSVYPMFTGVEKSA